MHVEAERRRCRSTLFLANLGKRQPKSAKFPRNRRQQIAGLAQILEIFEKEAVLPVVTSGSLRAALQQFLRQDRLAWHFGHLPVRRPNSWWCLLQLKFCDGVDLLAALSRPLGRLSGPEVFGERREV